MSVAVVGNEVDCKTRVAHVWGLAFDDNGGRQFSKNKSIS